MEREWHSSGLVQPVLHPNRPRMEPLLAGQPRKRALDRCDAWNKHLAGKKIPLSNRESARDQRTPAVFSRGSSPRPSIHADVRYIDDVIAFLRKTQLPQGMDADQLRVDGNRSPRARYPNANPETDQCKPHTNKQTQRLTAPPRNGRLKKGSCVLFSARVGSGGTRCVQCSVHTDITSRNCDDVARGAAQGRLGGSLTRRAGSQQTNRPPIWFW